MGNTEYGVSMIMTYLTRQLQRLWTYLLDAVWLACERPFRRWESHRSLRLINAEIEAMRLNPREILPWDDEDESFLWTGDPNAFRDAREREYELRIARAVERELIAEGLDRIAKAQELYCVNRDSSKELAFMASDIREGFFVDIEEVVI